MGDGALAEDVVQDSALTALDKLDQFARGSSFIAWMSTIVRYTALNAARRHRRHAASEIGSVEDPNLQVGGDSMTLPAVDPRGNLSNASAFDDDVVRALFQLEEPARASLLLRTVLDLSYAEIAKALDMPEGTAMSHVHRARRAMRAALGDRATPEVTDA